MIRPPVIVHVDDEAGVLECVDLILCQWLTSGTLVSFQNSRTAWEVLSATNPDLLIIDDKMPGLCGGEICQRLLMRGAKFPIIAHSPWEPTEQWVRVYAKQGLSIQFLACPFVITDLQAILRFSLKTPYWRDEE